MRRRRVPRYQQRPGVPQTTTAQPPAPTDTVENNVVAFAKVIQEQAPMEGTNSEYPDAYEQQESAILEQIIARRRAFMQQYGKAEQKFMQKGGDLKPVNAIRSSKEQDSIRALFS